MNEFTKALIKKIQEAGKVEATKAMKVMGYIVVAEGENIIKKFADGRIEIISPINKNKKKKI